MMSLVTLLDFKLFFGEMGILITIASSIIVGNLMSYATKCIRMLGIVYYISTTNNSRYNDSSLSCGEY